MPRFGYVLGSPLKLKFLIIMSFIQLANSTLQWRLFEFTTKAKLIWDTEISRGNIKYGQQFDNWIKFVLYHLYVVEYICSCISPIVCFVKLYPVLTWSRPKLILPWLITHGLDITVRKIISVIIIVILYSADVLPLSTFVEYLAVESVNMFLAMYNWYTSIGLFWDLTHREANKKSRILRIDLRESEFQKNSDISKTNSFKLHQNYISVPNLKEIADQARADERSLDRSKSVSTISSSSSPVSEMSVPTPNEFESSLTLVPNSTKVLNMTKENLKRRRLKLAAVDEILVPHPRSKPILENRRSVTKLDQFAEPKPVTFASSTRICLQEPAAQFDENEIILAEKFMKILNVSQVISDEVSFDTLDDSMELNEYSGNTNNSGNISSLGSTIDSLNKNPSLELKQSVQSNKCSCTSVNNAINAREMDHIANKKPSDEDVAHDIIHQGCYCSETDSDNTLVDNDNDSSLLAKYDTNPIVPKVEDNSSSRYPNESKDIGTKSEKTKSVKIILPHNVAPFNDNTFQDEIQQTVNFILENCVDLPESKVELETFTQNLPQKDNLITNYVQHDDISTTKSISEIVENPKSSTDSSQNWNDINLKAKEVTHALGLIEQNSVTQTYKPVDQSRPPFLNTEFIDNLYKDMKQFRTTSIQQYSDNAEVGNINNTKYPTLSGSPDYCKNWVALTNQESKNSDGCGNLITDNPQKVTDNFENLESKPKEVSDMSINPNDSNPVTSNSEKKELENSGSSGSSLDTSIASSVLAPLTQSRISTNQQFRKSPEKNADEISRDNLNNKENATANKTLNSKKLRKTSDIEYLKMYNDLTLVQYKKQMLAKDKKSTSSSISVPKISERIIRQSNERFGGLGTMPNKRSRSKPLDNNPKRNAELLGKSPSIRKQFTKYRSQNNSQALRSPTISCKRMEGATCGRDLIAAKAKENLRDATNEQSQLSVHNSTKSFDDTTEPSILILSGSSFVKEFGNQSVPKRNIREAMKNIDWSIRVNDDSIMTHKKPKYHICKSNSFAESELFDIFDGDTLYLLHYALSFNDERGFQLCCQPSEIYPIYETLAISLSEIIKGTEWRSASQEHFFQPELEDDVEILFNDGPLVDEIVISVGDILEKEETDLGSACLYINGTSCMTELVNSLDEFINKSNKTLESFQNSIDEMNHFERIHVPPEKRKEAETLPLSTSRDYQKNKIASVIAKAKDDLKKLHKRERDLINMINEYKGLADPTTDNRQGQIKNKKSMSYSSDLNYPSTSAGMNYIIGVTPDSSESKFANLHAILEGNNENEYFDSPTVHSIESGVNKRKVNARRNIGNIRKFPHKSRFQYKFHPHQPRRGGGLSSSSTKNYAKEASIVSSGYSRQSNSSRINVSDRHIRRLPYNTPTPNQIKKQKVKIVPLDSVSNKSSVERLKTVFDHFAEAIVKEKRRVSDDIFKNRIRELAKTPQFANISSIFSEKGSLSVISSEIELESIERSTPITEFIYPINNPLIYEMSILRKSKNSPDDGPGNSSSTAEENVIEDELLQVGQMIEHLLEDMLEKVTEENAMYDLQHPQRNYIPHIEDSSGLDHIYKSVIESVSATIQRWAEDSDESLGVDIGLRTSQGLLQDRSMENSLMEEF